MNQRVLIPLALLSAAAFLAAYPEAGHPQSKPAADIYVVKSGDTLLSIAEAVRPQEATMNQMALALLQANTKTFQSRDTLRLPSRTQLSVPEAKTVLATDPQTAEAEVARVWRADQHYRAALTLEKSKDMFYAFDTYIYAAKLGHGRAQLRLGQLYDNDFSGFVRHDLQESMRWYEKARGNQVEVSKTGARTGGGFLRP